MNPQRKPHQFNTSILREYDIRGKIGETLFDEDAFAIGCAFGTMIRRRGGSKVSVGYDGRPSSPLYADLLIKGLLSTGVDVTAIGMGPSPMLYFAVKSRKTDGGIMITGSHNPPEYNGFKMMFYDAPVYGELVTKVGTLSSNADYETGEGQREDIDISDAYVERLLQDYTSQKPFKIAWDNGNGAGGEILQKLVQKLPGEHILLYEDVDGTFPNHHPDPTVDKNLQDLVKCVTENNCDLGIAFDGDADRIGVVDETGRILKCDLLMALYARDVLKTHSGASIVGDVKCSQTMFDEIARLGGKPVMWKTGHSLIKSKMAEVDSPLAGELSGHIFFADKYYGYDDALYCAIRLLNLIADEDKKLSELTSHLPELYSTEEIRFEVDESEKFSLIEKIVTDVKSQASQDIQVNDIDGVRVTTKDGWWLLRASNTQNVLVTRAEATSADGLEKLKSMLQEEVEKIGYHVPFTN